MIFYFILSPLLPGQTAVPGAGQPAVCEEAQGGAGREEGGGTQD